MIAPESNRVILKRAERAGACVTGELAQRYGEEPQSGSFVLIIGKRAALKAHKVNLSSKNTGQLFNRPATDVNISRQRPAFQCLTLNCWL